MNKEISIRVNDSVFSLRKSRIHVELLFIGCFAIQFVIYCILDYAGIIHNKFIKEYITEITFVISTLIPCVYYHIRDKKTHGIMQLNVVFFDRFLKIAAGNKEITVAYNNIIEVRKIMVIDRVHDKKGCYRVTIKCHGRRNLDLETIQDEYEEHLDFEKTELYAFYDVCKKAGIKCC